MSATLRPHQLRLLSEIRSAIDGGCLHLMAQAPTGFGKTICAGTLARERRDAGKRVIITVPALSLIDQTVEKFFAEGIRDVGVIQANHISTNYARPIQVASVQTLMRRPLPPADLVLIDEAHRWFDFYGGWMRQPEWADVPFIGLSATPWTRGLGRYFDRLVVGASIDELIDGKYLSRFRVFAPSSPDLEGVRTLAGDYHEGDLGKAVNKTALVADVVATWMERADNRPTLCFAVDRAHAKNLQTKFTEAGISAGYIDAYTDRNERLQIERDFHAGKITVVCNVGCLTTGVDWDVRCIILARPTKSEILFVQMVGRGLRTADGKEDCLILDHSDTHVRLGFVTDIHRDALHDGRERTKPDTRDKQSLPKKCPKCTFLKPPKMLVCPCCGFKPAPVCKVSNRDGELVEFTSRNTPKPAGVDPATFFCELKFIAAKRNYKSGWISNKFKEKFGYWPRGMDHLQPLPPSRETQGWVRSRAIAFARERSASWA